MNQDQISGLGRTLLTMLGTALGTWLVTKGYLTSSQVSSLGSIMSDVGTAILPALPIVLSVWGTLHANSAKGKIASTAAIPEVAKVTLVPTAAGQALAAALPAKVTT